MSAYTNDANVAYEDSHAVLEVGPPLELMGSPHRPSEDVHAAVPALPLARIFTLFLGFGLRSWGGPMAQIAMLRTYFIDEQKWISNARFNRVLAVYQALPGPEATELCCYFGMISRGRPGAAVAGLGFLLPGFFMVLLLSFLYDRYDIVRNEVFAASFAAVQAAVAAMVVRAVHRIAEGALKEERTGEFSFRLLIIAGMAAVQVAMGLNFFISLAFCGILNEALLWESLPFLAGRGAGNRVEFTNEPVDDITTTSRSSPVASPSSMVSPPSSATWIGIAVGVVFTVLCLVGYIIYVATVGWPKGDFVFGSSSSRSLGSLFGTGLLAGLLTFGGAYTAIPFVQQGVAAWMPSTVFLDGLALSAVVPAPLVIFTTFVGYIGGGFGGAFLMTLGMFLPAFSFTLIGHSIFEKVVDTPAVTRSLDGITAGVIGLIAMTAVDLTRAAVVTNTGAVINPDQLATAVARPALSAIVFTFSLIFLYVSKNRYTALFLVAAAALAGQKLYR